VVLDIHPREVIAGDVVAVTVQNLASLSVLGEIEEIIFIHFGRVRGVVEGVCVDLQLTSSAGTVVRCKVPAMDGSGTYFVWASLAGAVEEPETGADDVELLFAADLFWIDADNPAAKFIFAIDAILFILYFVSIGLVAYYWTVPIIKAGQPAFLILLLGSCILGLIASIILIGKPSTTRCSAQLWLASLTFTTSMGTIVAKTYRLFLIFENQKVKHVKITDRDVMRMIAILVAIDVIILVSLQSASPAVTAVSFNKDPAVLSCSYFGVKSSGLLGLFAGYKALLWISGLYLAWYNRKITVAQLNDSRSLAFCTYNIAFFFGVFILFGNLVSRSSPVIGFVANALGIILAGVGVASILVATRLYQMFFVVGDAAIDMTGGDSIDNDSSSSKYARQLSPIANTTNNTQRPGTNESFG
jgi:hypothetical protein